VRVGRHAESFAFVSSHQARDENVHRGFAMMRIGQQMLAAARATFLLSRRCNTFPEAL